MGSLAEFVDIESAVVPNTAYDVTEVAGSYTSTLSNWITERLSKDTEKQHRDTINARAEDLVSNDPHAASVVDGITVNTIGNICTKTDRKAVQKV